MKSNPKGRYILAAAVLFFICACKAGISRTGNGSVTVETTITQHELQQVVTASITDPLVKEATVSLQSGPVVVRGARQRLNDPGKTDVPSFRLDLGARDGQLSSSISSAQIDGVAIEQNRVALLGQKNPNSRLLAVAITPESVPMIWNVVRQ